MLLRKMFVVAALFAVCLPVQMPVAAQSGQSSVLYAAPSRLMLKGDKDAAKEAAEGKLLREKFYPLGWSKDGKFAYLVEPPDEACDCYFAQFVIQDLRTDKILWEHNYDSDNSRKEHLGAYWKKHQKELSGKLAEHKIIAQRGFALQNSAIPFRKDWLTPDLKVVVNEETIGGGITGNVILRLVSKERGAKTLYERTLDPEKYETFINAELAGSLLSPFESRAAVVMIEKLRGWEGPPHITRIRIVGADLGNGFK